jgi:predicted GIY-YIG superfamily endonuclease
MPKNATNYSKTIMYQICCKDLLVTEKYVGHTTNFTQRKRQHKTTIL